MADYDATDTTPKLSDTDTDSSEDESAGEQVETLVAGRERRKTAGNRYDRDMILEEVAAVDEDADEVTLLFADNEDEEDEEFKSSEEEEDADLSSSDDDDQGPNAAVDDLEGEKELDKQAKQERAKKRRADLALTSVAGLRKRLKTDPTRPAAPLSQAKPSKRKERVTWVHDPDSGRSSLRKQTIAHRAETIARLKESEAQSKKMKALKEQRDRERAKDAPKELTQADRLAEAARVEKQNAKSLNRWETMEKKRQEEQAAKLAALKNRKLEGPVITWWSARAKWIGPKLSKIGTKDAGNVIEGGVETKKRGRKSKAFLEQQALEQQAAAKEAELGTPVLQKTSKESPGASQIPAPAPAAGPAVPSSTSDEPEKPPREKKSETTLPSETDQSQTTRAAPQQQEDTKISDATPPTDAEPSQTTRAAPQQQEDTKMSDATPPTNVEPSQTTLATPEQSEDTKKSDATPLSETETSQTTIAAPPRQEDPKKSDATPPSEIEQMQTTLAAPQQQEDTLLKGILEYASLEGESNISTDKPVSSTPQTPNVQQPQEQNLEGQPKTEDSSKDLTVPSIQIQQTEKTSGQTPPVVAPKSQTPDLQETQPPAPSTTEGPAATVSTAEEASSAPEPLPAAGPPSVTKPPIAPEPLPTAAPPTATASPLATKPSAAPEPFPTSGPSSVTEPPPAPEVAPPPGPEPIVENSTRNIVILERFDELSNESRQDYSFFFNTRKAAKPVKHSQELCPITTLPVRYRDSPTGIGYANVVGYKKLQELKQHRFAWSSMLGCYVGRDGGVVARGVPEGFVDK